ncbi:MAG: nicotinamide riboside transporter PnuC [Chitinophagales bacterium]
MDSFSVNCVVITIYNYPLSFIELIGTAFGLCSVALAAREKVLNYPIGLINVILFFLIFYQVQLYSDMILQVYFFIISIYGWWRWLSPTGEFEAKANHELRITNNTLKTNTGYILLVAIGVVILGTVVKNLHLWLPTIFKLPAAFPYLDSYVAVASMVAMYLLARKKLENWILWISVDALCIVLYFVKNIKLMSFEYLLFFLIASFGLWNWFKEFRESQFENSGKVNVDYEPSKLME